MTLREAIETRHSVRAYKNQSLAEDVVKMLVHAKRGFSMIGYTQMYLGIAKYHFEIGAGKEDDGEYQSSGGEHQPSFEWI